MTTPTYWLRHPIDAVRAHIQQFWLSRLQPSDQLNLSQRNVYILPAPAGWMLGFTLAILLLASINYQLNLGYILTFMVAGSAVAGMHIGHATLRGLHLQLRAPAPVFAGQKAALKLILTSQRRSPRSGIGVAPLGQTDWVWTEVPAGGSAEVELFLDAPQRGLHPLPPLTLETRFPLGSFRVWTVWRPASTLLVYPTPEPQPPRLPALQSSPNGERQTQVAGNDEPDGVRPYRHGDAMKRIVWKKWAKTGVLISRDATRPEQQSLWLDFALCGLVGSFAGGADASHELKLSRLCAWVLSAERAQVRYGLRLPGQEIAPGTGPTHRNDCLRALTLWQTKL